MITGVDKRDRFEQLPAERFRIVLSTCLTDTGIVVIACQFCSNRLQRLAYNAAHRQELAGLAPVIEMAPEPGCREIEYPSPCIGDHCVEARIVGADNIAASVRETQ